MGKFETELLNIMNEKERAMVIIKLVDQIKEQYKSIVCDFIINCFTREIELSEKTIENYTRNIKLFLEWYRGKELKEFSRIDSKRYRAYLKEDYKYKGRAIGIKSINTKIVAANQFLKYLDEELGYKIIIRIKQIKIEQQNFANELITNDHIIRILRQAKKANDHKAIAIFYTLFYTGARVSEMLQLKINDVAKDSVMIKGKGNKYRELLIAERLKVQLKEYLEYRREPLKEEYKEYLFTSREGVITRQTVHKLIKIYCGKARGIKKEIAHAHAFRHRYSQNLSEMGVNQTIISQLLGHSLTVTGIYIQQDRKELLRIINRMSLEEVRTL
ncbi:tyrosine-type recombinase/integrase [Clostridium sp. OS1-26]|uniref:tyrosine-type recombinase/integrase n=1 Tax=Clostridium sp. OS1-26 TaxID=3070681 RepID=UPI0027DFF449|nr:tyrosine-type recombinase/integrase [Clostridium sp. OS1-26]WML35662.1 tyrosine-type recombinase/integrase [Clostridium sp. OS1-26]